jgi:hypothetical protein
MRALDLLVFAAAAAALYPLCICATALYLRSRPCGPGTQIDFMASGTCVKCPAGHYRAHGHPWCKPCPINFYAAGPGSTKCERCLPGEVSKRGQASCHLCPAGTFAGETGVCEQCSDGSWSEEGSDTCSCNKGWTSGKTAGRNICDKCAPNTFKAVRGSAACQACPFSMVSPEASGDVQQCVPEDMLSSLSVGLQSFLKGTGFVEEEPSERRWRQHTAEAVGAALTHASSRLQDLGAQASQHLLSQLYSIVLELFASLSEFNSFLFSEAESWYSNHVCSSERNMKVWLDNRKEYHDWYDAKRAVKTGRNKGLACAKMKKAARSLLKILHPDKFKLVHPTCREGASTFLVQIFTEEYEIQKLLCAGHAN